MNQLIERMLAVSAGLTPNDWASLVRNWVTVTIHIFTVRLHISLLEISWETVHVLVIWQNRFGFCTKEIVIPDANQCELYWQILLNRRIGKMLVHGMSAAQQLFEIIETNA